MFCPHYILNILFNYQENNGRPSHTAIHVSCTGNNLEPGYLDFIFDITIDILHIETIKFYKNDQRLSIVILVKAKHVCFTDVLELFLFSDILCNIKGRISRIIC